MNLNNFRRFCLILAIGQYLYASCFEAKTKTNSAIREKEQLFFDLRKALHDHSIKKDLEKSAQNSSSSSIDESTNFTILSGDGIQNPSINPNNDQLQPVFSEELVDEFFNKIDWQAANTAAEIFEKRMLFNAIVAAINNKSTIDKDKKANLFKPIYPDKIETIETDQPINKYEIVMKSLEKEYIGPIPNQISDMIGYFAFYNECIENKISIQNHLLLHGKSGTGKTYLVEELSNALQIPYFSIPAAYFLDDNTDESLLKIKETFSAASSFNKPVLFFIDEIDAIVSQFEESTHNGNRATLAILLKEIKEIQKSPHVFVIAATKNKEALDKTVLNRFSGAICEIKPLCQNDKVKLLEKLCKDHNISNYTGYPEALANVLKSDCFSNEDLRVIVITARIKYLADFERNEGKPQEPEAMHKYFRRAIDAIGKDASYPWRGTFGSGI